MDFKDFPSASNLKHRIANKMSLFLDRVHCEMNSSLKHYMFYTTVSLVKDIDWFSNGHKIPPTFAYHVLETKETFKNDLGYNVEIRWSNSEHNWVMEIRW